MDSSLESYYGVMYVCNFINTFFFTVLRLKEKIWWMQVLSFKNGFVLVFNGTFTKYIFCISVISWASFIGGGNRSTRRKPLTCRKSMTNIMLYRVHLAMYVVRMKIAKNCNNIWLKMVEKFCSVTMKILCWKCWTSNFLVEVAVVNVYLEISVELDIFRTYGRSPMSI